MIRIGGKEVEVSRIFYGTAAEPFQSGGIGGHPILGSGKRFCDFGGITVALILALASCVCEQCLPFRFGWQMPTIRA